MRQLTAIFLFIVIAFCNTSTAQEIIINDPDWPPYFFKGERYQPIGFAKEVLKLCLPKTGYQARFAYHPIKRMRNYIESGKIDVHIYSYKPTRESFLNFGKEPIFKTSYKPFINKKSPFEIHSIEDFKGLRIGHLQGLKYSTDYLRYLESKLDSGYVRSVTTNVSLITLLHDQKIDTFVNTVDTVYWLSTTLGMREDILAVDFDIQTKDYFVAVSKKSSRIKDKNAFLNTLDKCIKASKASGLYDKIKAGYGI
ncbi:substrate-binding periplasmic protein [Pseudoalteromonas sp. G4]|uniref:substrate-binding periplasmic protein n=1 Tax=Pseudoalteromonas sp. G4 TaxID=2992761 RepID=UPI00237E042E|nr:transporter substrate-binding domain-containing protein [Pseudoalteromonas sp. G4]MDE3271843.1 transporter substrate-binding domain-containing protein [Pseudoalteromonas sp. G4]